MPQHDDEITEKKRRKAWVDQWILQFMAARTAVIYTEVCQMDKHQEITNPVGIIEEAVFLAEQQYNALQAYLKDSIA